MWSYPYSVSIIATVKYITIDHLKCNYSLSSLIWLLKQWLEYHHCSFLQERHRMIERYKYTYLVESPIRMAPLSCFPQYVLCYGPLISQCKFFTKILHLCSKGLMIWKKEHEILIFNVFSEVLDLLVLTPTSWCLIRQCVILSLVINSHAHAVLLYGYITSTWHFFCKSKKVISRIDQTSSSAIETARVAWTCSVVCSATTNYNKYQVVHMKFAT